MLEVEQKYAYRQSQQLKMQCEAIGYLRGDFAKSGNEFHSTWFDEVASRKTPEFSAQFDDVVNALRKQGGLFASRKAMLSLCASNHPDANFPSYPEMQQYGFRVDCGEYAYLVKCNPHASDDYNFWMFAYKAQWLDRNIEQAAKGIRFIDSKYNTLFHVNDGDSIAITRDGVMRQYECRYLDETHVEVGNELYHICQFAEIMERNASTYAPVSPFVKTLPMKCYAVRPSSEMYGEFVEVRNGHNGAMPYPAFGDLRMKNQADVDILNEKIGVTKAQAAAMLHGCLHGWDTYGADPAHYDKNGQPLKKKPRETER